MMKCWNKQKNLVDGADTAQMKALEDTYVTAVGDSSLRAKEECGKNHGPIDQSRCLVLHAFVAPDTFL